MKTERILTRKLSKHFGLILFVIMIVQISVARATMTTYKVIGIFNEPQTRFGCGTFGCTKFTGTFNWDPDTETISGLQGTQNVTMHDPSRFPDISLTHQLAQSVTGNIVTATVFKENTIDVFSGGGYEVGDDWRYGFLDGNTPNENAFFTLVFDKTTMTGITDKIVYGDCTPGGLMGVLCMTGYDPVKLGHAGSMDGRPLSLSITTVPLPAAVYLFGSALLGLISVRQERRQVI